MGHNQQRIVFHNSPKNFSYAVYGDWLDLVALLYGYRIKQLNYYFVSREKIVEINTSHLNHDYATDIITFDYCRQKQILGEVYVCCDVVLENAKQLSLNVEDELRRVVVHGLLHLLGYKDKTTEEQLQMREKENECLRMIASNE